MIDDKFSLSLAFPSFRLFNGISISYNFNRICFSWIKTNQTKPKRKKILKNENKWPNDHQEIRNNNNDKNILEQQQQQNKYDG